MTKTYENLCQMLNKEVETIAQSKAFTKESLELLKCLVETLEGVKHLMKEEEEAESGMSSRGGRSSRMMMPYYDEMAMAAAMAANAQAQAQRRDNMGRFMEYDPNMMMDGGGSSRNSYARGGNSSREYREYRDYNEGRGGGYSNGYSRDDSRKKMVRKLETLMDDTMSEHEREAIQNCINKIEQ